MTDGTNSSAPRPTPQRARRELLIATGAAAAAIVSGGCSGKAAPGTGGPAVQAQKKVRWTLASSFPSSLDAMFGPAQFLAERLRAMSDGSFEISVHQASEIVPAFEVLEAVQGGAVEVGQTASYYYTGKCAALAFGTCVPFGLTARQQQAWLHRGEGKQLIGSLYADFGIEHFPAGNTGVQMGGWFRRQVETAADLKGLRMRIPGLGGQVMSELGVSVQNLPGGEIYTALEMDRIDATEWVGPYDDEKLGFYKRVQNYYYPGWWEPGPELAFLVGRAAWDKLSPSHQAMFIAASREAAAEMQQRYDAQNPAALARLVAAGVEVRPFSQELMDVAHAASEELLANEAAKDPTYAAILDSWRRFRGDAAAWFGTAELAYAANIARLASASRPR